MVLIHEVIGGFMNKNVVIVVLLVLSVVVTLMLPLSISVYAATDLPIDIDEVSQIEGMGTRAVTVRRGIDLFTDRSRVITNAMDTQHEVRRREAIEGLFDPLFQIEELTGDERLMERVISSGLFRERVFFREGGEAEIVDGEPILLIIILFIICGIIGFIIAKLSLGRKEEKNVY